MTPSEAAQAKADGVILTAHKWIAKIETDWERQLGTGRDTLWIDSLDQQPDEVVSIVIAHFLKLGYGFQKEERNGYADTYPVYRMRITPLPPKEPGVFSRLITRLLGGAHA